MLSHAIDSFIGEKKEPTSRNRTTANQTILKKPWSNEEDDRLRQCVMLNGTSNWSIVAEHMPERSGKQCRERWHNHLSPALVFLGFIHVEVNKGAWTEEEDRIIITMQEKIGNQWAKITKLLPGRSDNAVKNRFHMAMRAKNRELRSQVTDALIEEELKLQAKSRQGTGNDYRISLGSEEHEQAQQNLNIKQQEFWRLSEAKSPFNESNSVSFYVPNPVVNKNAYDYYCSVISTSTSPVVLPSNCEFPTVVPVIQSFPSPPLSPSVAMSGITDDMQTNSTIEGESIQSSSSSVMYNSQSTEIPFVHAEICSGSQESFRLNQQSYHYANSTSGTAANPFQQHRNGSEVWNDDSMIETFDDLLCSTPVTMSPTSILIDEPDVAPVEFADIESIHPSYPASDMHQMTSIDAYNGGYLNSSSSTTSPNGSSAMYLSDMNLYSMQQQQLLQQQQHHVSMYFASQGSTPSPNSEMEVSSSTEPQISMAFMHTDDDNLLYNWAQDESQQYSPSSNNSRQSAKRCGSTWCGVGVRGGSGNGMGSIGGGGRLTTLASPPWGSSTSAFCGLGATSWKPALPSIHSAGSYRDSNQSGIGMGAARTESPVRKQQRPSNGSSGWRMGW